MSVLSPTIQGYVEEMAEKLVKGVRMTVDLFGDAIPEVRAAKARLGEHFDEALLELVKREGADIVTEYVTRRLLGQPTNTLLANAGDRVLGGLAHTTLKDDSSADNNAGNDNTDDGAQTQEKVVAEG